MNYKEYAFTASEITQLEYILSIMPESRRVTRIGLEHRLKKARQRVEGISIPPRPKSVHVNFQGEPVVDMVGMDANFAGKATTAFAESTAITTAGAAGQLRDRGTIPHQGLGRQLISGVTSGSFGFEIELPPPTEEDIRRGQTDNPAEKAIEMIQDLLETSLAGTDEELATLTDQMHPRAVRKVAEFLKILKNNRAQVTIELNRREVALTDPGEVERAVNRLAVQNIREETTTTTGTLVGIIPARRFFEFRSSGTDEFIEGGMGQEIHDPYRVAARYQNKKVRAKIRQLQVGQSQPKYTLLEILGTMDGRESP